MRGLRGVMEDVTYTITERVVLLAEPEFRFPTGTPQTDEMKSMVDHLREEGAASPVTHRQLLGAVQEMQRRIDAEFFIIAMGGHRNASTDVEPL